MFVYFIRAGNKGAIKIGLAKNVQRRMECLQIGNAFELKLLAVIPCKNRKEAEWIEGRLHKRFTRQRIRGEWFQGNIEIRTIRDEFEEINATLGEMRYDRDQEKEAEKVAALINEELDNQFFSIMN